MNENKYIRISSPATKVSVTISRRQLWNNFIDCWKDIAWDNYAGVSLLKEVADVLLDNEPIRMRVSKLRRLFSDGHTAFFMGDAMKELDVVQNDHLLREIVVVDQNAAGETVNEFVIIRHEDIKF